MTTLRNERKLAAVTRETQEENPRNGQSRNTPVPRINEEYITQVSEEIEGRITKKLSQEFNRIESRIADALSKLDEFLLNQQITTHSETVPGTFRNTNAENQGTNEDDSQSDPHPEAGIFCGQNAQNSDVEDCCDSVFYSRFLNTGLKLRKLLMLIWAFPFHVFLIHASSCLSRACLFQCLFYSRLLDTRLKLHKQLMLICLFVHVFLFTQKVTWKAYAYVRRATTKWWRTICNKWYRAEM